MAVSVASGLKPQALLKLLADGQRRSGERLAEQLGVSRAAVWKGIERLRLRGIDIEAVPRRGYALTSPVELLEEEGIRAPLAPEHAAQMRSLVLEFDVDSTNSRLLDLPPPPIGLADVMMSELQHAGRGRRGRQWIAPFGTGIALSLAWSFSDASRAIPALSLSVGVAVARALTRGGAREVRLKWPNDIWFGARKIGGVLLELRAEASGPAHVVIGIGLNVSLDLRARARIDATGVRVAAVADACVDLPSRNFIAGAIIDELLSMLTVFESEGFAAHRCAWTALDALHDRPVQLLIGERTVFGTARGVDAQGALRLERAGRVQEYVSGEVSLRPVEDDS